MNAPQHIDQSDLLTRLYGLKQKQLLQASSQGDSLQYRVLQAEASAISDAIKKLPPGLIGH